MSEQIYDPNENFPFQDLEILTPKSVLGGNYFSRFHLHDSPIFIQLPKCSTKAGVQISGSHAKKAFCDLQFTPDHEKFLRWMEQLIERIQDILVEHRKEWFETEMDREEIEDTFQNPLKPYKSGKLYLMRANVSIKMGKIILPIFNEEEHQVEVDYLKGGSSILGILEIQGLKYSSKCLQLEMEMKQVLCLYSLALFDKCLLRGVGGGAGAVNVKDNSVDNNMVGIIVKPSLEKKLETEAAMFVETEPMVVAMTVKKEVDREVEKDLEDSEKLPEVLDVFEPDFGEMVVHELETGIETEPVTESVEEQPEEQQEFQTVDICLDTMSLEPMTNMQLKNGKEIYYKMYREARQKAKLARDLAISSYLESKHIKNIYVLEDLSDDEEEKFFSLSLSQRV
jgi:hypothetical protein